MSPPATGCLTLEAFQQIADQSTDADDVRRWASHLAGCPGCITTTRALRAEAVVVQAVTDRLGPWEPLLAAVRAALGMADLTPSSATPLPTRSGVVDTYLTLDRFSRSNLPLARWCRLLNALVLREQYDRLQGSY